MKNSQDEQLATPGTIYRGGTSKALLINRAHIPFTDDATLEQWIRAAMGSPDLRQIDGLGGADPLTSKFAIIGPSAREDADLDYHFYQVGIDKPTVQTSTTCGNIASAVAPFALDEGMVTCTGDELAVRIYDRNINGIIRASVPVVEGRPSIAGDERIDGVPGTGAAITLDFSGTIGGHTGKLLPTGRRRDVLTLEDGSTIAASVVELANLLVFVAAADMGITGAESPTEIERNTALLERVALLRRAVLRELQKEHGSDFAPSTFISLVAPPRDWTDYATRERHAASECDILVRGIGASVHKVYWATGSACTAAAALIPGTVVHAIAANSISSKAGLVRLGHPCGVNTIRADIVADGDTITVNHVSLKRTARRIMQGQVYVPKWKL